jgi:beta-galactosidase/beta-glucuronidase
MTNAGDVARQLPPTALDGSYPRPQLLRDRWVELSGTWMFASDDQNVGIAQRWFDSAAPFDREIRVPFPPESSASGIGDPGFHPVVWYRRDLFRSDLLDAGLGIQGGRVILHFAAVDYRADVWLAGHYLGEHEGGHTPFAFDVTHVIDGGSDALPLVVRAEDDRLDVAQPRGKQDWQKEPHAIWYRRTSGIWQPVWLEAVPEVFVANLAWSSDIPGGTVEMALDLSERPRGPARVVISIRFGEERLADLQFLQSDPRACTVITLPRQANGQAYESLLWSPENPRLLDASVQVLFNDGTSDRVDSYLGLRSVGWSDGHFMLNDRPYYLRAVLEQGFWPDSHLAAPDAAALREEVQLIRNLGFNAVRIHQRWRIRDSSTGPTGSAFWSGRRMPAPTGSPRRPWNGRRVSGLM